MSQLIVKCIFVAILVIFESVFLLVQMGIVNQKKSTFGISVLFWFVGFGVLSPDQNVISIVAAYKALAQSPVTSRSQDPARY